MPFRLEKLDRLSFEAAYYIVTRMVARNRASMSRFSVGMKPLPAAIPILNDFQGSAFLILYYLFGGHAKRMIHCGSFSTCMRHSYDGHRGRKFHHFGELTLIIQVKH